MSLLKRLGKTIGGSVHSIPKKHPLSWSMKKNKFFTASAVGKGEMSSLF
jgi:hypothetical protein